jgi:hypothetical protein
MKNVMVLKVTTDGLARVLDVCARFQRGMNALYTGEIRAPVSIDEIVHAVENKYNIKVEINIVPIDSKHVHGLVEIWDDKIVIHVDSEKPEATRRYIITKEIVHRIIWTAESETKNPSILIEILVQQHLMDGTGNDIPKDVESEGLALFGAIELLFPMNLRYEAKRRLTQEGDVVTPFIIAEELKIPAYIVEFALSDRYMKLCQRVHGDDDL